MRSAIVLVPSLLLATCLSRPVTPAGCAKDVDCKGDRICERGACVEPRAKPDAGAAMQQAGVAAQQEPVPTQQTIPDGGAPAFVPITPPGAAPAFHGDFAHAGRSRFTVSTRTPKHHVVVPAGGTVVSSPAITDDGLAVFGSHDKLIRAVVLDEKRAAASVRWSHATGDMVWSSPALLPASLLAPILGAPDAGAAPPLVLIGSDDDHLYALDTVTGDARWTFSAGPCKRAIGFGPEAARCDVDGVTVGPDGTIYLVADGAYALRPDGVLKWRFALKTHCASAPAVGPDGTIYFGCQDGRIYAVAPDGTKRWDFRTGDDIDDAPAVAPDGTIYVGSDDRKLYALSPAGALRFALKTGGDVRSSPALAVDGTIYAGSFDGNLYAVRPDGSVKWTFSTADRILSSPTIDAAGTILIGSQDDRLYAVAPDGKLVWSVLLEGDVDGTAAIGPRGEIYVGSDDKALHVLY